MSVIEKLQPASFRGVPFLVNSETRTGGKKIVTHEYVNNDERFTEELGALPPSFTIQAIVGGDDAIQRRFDLERVMTIPGLGKLVHPVYGSVDVKSTTFSVTSNQKNVGEFRFSINFESSKDNITVQPSVLTNSAVSGKAEEAREAALEALESFYVDPETVATSVSLADKLTGMMDTVNENISSFVNPIQENLSTFSKIVNEVKTEVSTVIQNGVKLRSSLEAVYESALSVASSPEDLFQAWLNLTTFGNTDLVSEINTIFRLNKENDLSVMNEHTRVNAMINLYESTVYVEFQTEQDLDEVRVVLDDTFNALMRSYPDVVPSEVATIVKNTEVRNAISELRTVALQVLDEKEKNAWKVVSIESGLSSMALASFRYYGNLDTLDLLKTLNNETNWSSFNEEIRAVSR